MVKQKTKQTPVNYNQKILTYAWTSLISAILSLFIYGNIIALILIVLSIVFSIDILFFRNEYIINKAKYIAVVSLLISITTLTINFIIVARGLSI